MAWHSSFGIYRLLADPAGSVLADYIRTGKVGQAGSCLVEGIGEDFIPGIADLSRVRQAYTIGDAEALETARLLLRNEGTLAGSSTGTLRNSTGSIRRPLMRKVTSLMTSDFSFRQRLRC